MKFTEHTLFAPLPEDLLKLKWYGDFPVMERVINRRLTQDIPNALKDRLLAELEIIRRLPGQYPYSWDEALNLMQAHFRDFLPEEFQKLWEEGAMDWIYIQGRVHFKSNFLENLVKTREWLCRRLAAPGLEADKWENSRFLDQTIARMKEHGGMSCRFHMQTSLTINEHVLQAKEPVKVYLPVPLEYAQVKRFRLLKAQVILADGEILNIPVFPVSADPADEAAKAGQKGEGFFAWIAPGHTGQRTLCFQGSYLPGSRFLAEYTYQADMPYFDLHANTDPEARGFFPEEDADMPGHFLGQQLPHIRFTPYLKALAAEIIGQETKPLLKAKKIYDYITSHIMYSFVRDYFSITELVDYTASGFKGDCGLQALLFITLCRIAGIPARWQSGLYVRPGHTGCHDWAMFYLEEYGWLFADCSFGGSAFRMGNEERRNFYFGNLDPYRMPSCCQFQADFLPPVNGLRIDPYDNQTGEVEYAGGCLRSGQFETVHELLDSCCL